MSIRKFFIFILAAKIFILGAFLIVFSEDHLLWADTSTYLDLGRNVVTGNGFAQTATDGAVVPNTRFMPLYPTVIGFFSVYIPHGLVFVSLLQALAAAGIAVFVYKIGLFFLPHRWALGAALLTTFEPLISVIHILIMPETLFVFFLTGFAYFFLRYFQNVRSRTSDMSEVRLLTFALCMITLAVYTKPAALYLVAVPVLFLVFAKKKYLHAALFAAVFIFALMPWMARNSAVGGSFAVTNDDSGNICGWTLHGVIATERGVDPTDWTTTWNTEEFLADQKKCTSSFAALQLFLTEHPHAFIKTMMLSSLSLLTNDGYSVFFEKPQEEQIKPHHNFLTPAVFAMNDWQEKARRALQEFRTLELGMILAGRVFWFVILIFMPAGAFVLLRTSLYRTQALFIILILLYFVTVTIFVTAYGAGARLRYPINAFLLILAGAGAKWFYGMVWNRRTNMESPMTPNAVL